MKHIITLLLTCALALTAAFAQTDTLSRSLSGRIVDDQGIPVPFAHVVLRASAGGAVLHGATTADDGTFSLPATSGTFFLEVSSVGYERLTLRCSIEPKGLLLGDVILHAKQLEAVTVSATRTTEEVDRYVVLPKPEEVQAAGQALVLLDLLHLPGLRVDVPLQQVTVDGGVAILQINGKEVPLTRVANLKASQIKRVEYSNNPGTRYLDRGASGIINIILKEREDGGSLMAQAQSAVTTGFVNGYLLGSYHKGRSEFALEYTLGYRNYSHVPYQLEDNYLDPSRTVTRTQHTNMPFRYIDHTLNAEYTYQHDDSTMFVASLQDNFFNKTLTASGTMTETDRGLTTTQTMSQQQHRRDNLPKLDLFFTHRMPHGQKLELNVVGEYADNLYDNSLTYQLLSADGTAAAAPSTYATRVLGHGYAFSGEGVYSHKFGRAELRTGVQYQHNFSDNDYVLYSTHSTMTKDNLYLYAELLGPLGSRVTYSVGTGAKLLHVTDGQNSHPYLRNLSNARLNWRATDRLSLTAIVQYTPMLPTLAALSPVFQQTDDVEGVIGNPSLKPAEQLRDALMLRYTHPKGFYTDTRVGAMRIFHTYFDIYQYDANRDLFLLTYHSADLWYVPYAYAEVGVRGLWNHLNLSLNGIYYHYLSKGADFHHTRNNFTANANAQFYWNNLVAGANFTLLPNWTLLGETYSLSEEAQSLYLQYRWQSLQLMLAWHCPFNKDGYKYEVQGLSAVHPYRHAHWTADNGNMVVLGLTWQMDFGRRFSKSEKTLHNGGYDSGIVGAN